MTIDSNQPALDSAERSALESRVADLARGLEAAKQRIEQLERQLTRMQELVNGSGPRFDALYAEFEERFRGTFDEVTEKVRAYLPDVHRLLSEVDPPDGPRVLDIGCGRGEWLTVLHAARIPAAGVDAHPEFVEAAQTRGLDVVEGDAIEHLRSLPADSLDLVTAFHLIEHLDVETLLALLAAAQRVLRPGGCLLFETPNPSNLTMAARDFYNDPTHRTPLPSALTEFLLSASGFAEIEVRPLHPAKPEIDTTAAASSSEVERVVADALYGPQDYAILGYKVGKRPSQK
ncbi:MAG TPA: methyltransferase domain-containing protein [Propionibacteriaceae bacterium]|nr:methyltransferase domain-containing protein [Propionibacteriaceae bacterium]